MKSKLTWWPFLNFSLSLVGKLTDGFHYQLYIIIIITIYVT
jgi:hypothetical protein